MAEIFEIIMIVLFGVSWPMNIVRSVRAKTAKGKSILFLLAIAVGYVAGITSKLINETYLAQIGEKWYVLFFYVLNLIMVLADICLYFRNRHLDALRDAKAQAEGAGEKPAQSETAESPVAEPLAEAAADEQTEKE